MRTNKRIFAVLTGGGTAGHVLPVLEIALELERHGIDQNELLFVGTKRGVGIEMVREKGFECAALSGRGISGKNPVKLAVSIGQLGLGVLQALIIIATRRPRVVFTSGGYGGLTCALASLVFRVPLVVFEPNAVAGRTNKIVANWAKKSCVFFDTPNLPRQENVGTPLREEILEWSPLVTMDSEPNIPVIQSGPALVDLRDKLRSNARLQLSIDRSAFCALVVGGSLGAKRINESILEFLEKGADEIEGALVVRHVVGDRDWEQYLIRLRSVVDNASGMLEAQWGKDKVSIRIGDLLYIAVRFEAQMALAQASANVAISRAGAATVAELCASATPCILVPRKATF